VELWSETQLPIGQTIYTHRRVTGKPVTAESKHQPLNPYMTQFNKAFFGSAATHPSVPDGVATGLRTTLG
jgi:hypothetical protein